MWSAGGLRWAAMSDSWKRALVATIVALLTAAAGIATNLATEWKRNLWAWVAVGILTVAAAGVTTFASKRNNAGTNKEGSVTTSVETSGRVGGDSTTSVVSSGLIMRTSRIGPDGSRVDTEYYNVDIARIAIRQDLSLRAERVVGKGAPE